MASKQPTQPRSPGEEAPQPAKPVASSPVARGRVAGKRAAGSRAKAARTKTAARPKLSPVIPYLTVRDALASLAFYEQAFGFTRGETLHLPDGSLIQVAMQHAGAVAFKFSPEGNCSGSMRAPLSSGAENPIVLTVPCRRIDELAARARAAGATVVTEPEDMFWGERIARFVDLDGYLWCFAAKKGKFDPRKIPRVAEEVQLANAEAKQSQGADPESQQGTNVDFDLGF